MNAPATAPTLSPAVIARWRAVYPDALILIRVGDRRIVCWPPSASRPDGEVTPNASRAYGVAAIVLAHASGTPITILSLEGRGQ